MNWLDRYGVRRTLTLTAAVWMTWKVSYWSMHFAVTTALPGMEAAAVIAAVQAPISVFAGYVFKAYVEGKKA